jgi:hypothetical protein
MKYFGVKRSRIAKLAWDILNMHQPYLGRLLSPVLEDNLKRSAVKKAPSKAKKDATGTVKLEPTCST